MNCWDCPGLSLLAQTRRVGVPDPACTLPELSSKPPPGTACGTRGLVSVASSSFLLRCLRIAGLCEWARSLRARGRCSLAACPRPLAPWDVSARPRCCARAMGRAEARRPDCTKYEAACETLPIAGGCWGCAVGRFQHSSREALEN